MSLKSNETQFIHHGGRGGMRVADRGGPTKKLRFNAQGALWFVHKAVNVVNANLYENSVRWPVISDGSMRVAG